MNQLKSTLAALALFAAAPALAQTVLEATLDEVSQKTGEVSTKELRQIIADGSAIVLDARPPLEYAISHIPGALNVAPKPGLAAHKYVSDVAEVGRLVEGVKDRPLVLYCNGPFCGKVKRLGTELVQAGYTNVRRYQLGAPGWRALGGGAMETELEALPYINNDKTAVWIDARNPGAFATGSIAGARNVPASQLAAGKDQGVMQKAKDDGRLPMDDHNTRIIVFGVDGKQARAVADAIASEAFHNVSYLNEPFEALRRVSAQAHPSGHGSGGTSSQPVITPIMRSARTISGQPLRLPKEEAEVAAAAVDIPAGGALPIHQHPWSRFVYLERGSLRVHNHDTGASLDFQAGQVLPEVVSQWHEARALGSVPVRLIVIDLVPPGVNNTIMKGAAAAR